MGTPLPLAGEIPPPVRRPAAIAAKGFRPFFLLAAAFAAAILPLWMLALAGVVQPGGVLDPMTWHAHEMVFGFSVAVLAGFLLTAVGNWTQRETAIGAPLLGLAAVWLLGRVALSGALPLPRALVAALDLSFLPALAAAIGRALVGTKNRRNYVMLIVLAALWGCDVAVHLDAMGILAGYGRRATLLSVDIVVAVIVIMAGRIFPMFTRNATGAAWIKNRPRLDQAAIASTALAAVLGAALEGSRPAAIAYAAAAIFTAARAFGWGATQTFRTPLLWILHVGYAWVPIGFALRAASIVVPWIPPAVATHALTVGAIGGLTLGMMARVSLGHSGRPLKASPLAAAGFALVTLAASVRVSAPLIHADATRLSVFVAGTLWSLAFAAYLVVYAPILTQPRADGKPG